MVGIPGQIIIGALSDRFGRDGCAGFAICYFALIALEHIIHDATGSYRLAFLLVIACCIISVAAIWIAAPRNVRLVAGGRRASAPASGQLLPGFR